MRLGDRNQEGKKLIDKTAEYRNSLRIRFLNKLAIAIPANITAIEIGTKVKIRSLDWGGKMTVSQRALYCSFS